MLSPCAVIAARNDIKEDYKQMILKFLPVLRSKEFAMCEAAVYLENWVTGTMRMAPLVDVDASLVLLSWHELFLRCLFLLLGAVLATHFGFHAPLNQLTKPLLRSFDQTLSGRSAFILLHFLQTLFLYVLI